MQTLAYLQLWNYSICSVFVWEKNQFDLVIYLFTSNKEGRRRRSECEQCELNLPWKKERSHFSKEEKKCGAAAHRIRIESIFYIRVERRKCWNIMKSSD